MCATRLILSATRLFAIKKERERLGRVLKYLEVTLPQSPWLRLCQLRNVRVPQKTTLENANRITTTEADQLSLPAGVGKAHESKRCVRARFCARFCVLRR